MKSICGCFISDTLDVYKKKTIKNDYFCIYCGMDLRLIDFEIRKRQLTNSDEVADFSNRRDIYFKSKMKKSHKKRSAKIS